MLRPWPNHGTQRLQNDDDDDYAFPMDTSSDFLGIFWEDVRDCSLFRSGVFAVTMSYSVHWLSASARLDKTMHCLFRRMAGGIMLLTTDSMKVGVDWMCQQDTKLVTIFVVPVVEGCC